jgi:hypothetical protein
MRMYRGLWRVPLLLMLGLGLSAAVFDTPAVELWETPAYVRSCACEDVGDQPVAIEGAATAPARAQSGAGSRSRGLPSADAALPDAPANGVLAVRRGGPHHVPGAILPVLRC